MKCTMLQMCLYLSLIQSLTLLALIGKTNYKYKQAITIPYDKYSSKKTQKGLERSKTVSHTSIKANTMEEMMSSRIWPVVLCCKEKIQKRQKKHIIIEREKMAI